MERIKDNKKSGESQSFDREKILDGIYRACEKRPVNKEKIEMMVNNIEKKVRKKGKPVKTDFVGELVMKELRKVDKVAFIRFASVYRDFADISDFKQEIRSLIGKK